MYFNKSNQLTCMGLWMGSKCRRKGAIGRGGLLQLVNQSNPVLMSSEKLADMRGGEGGDAAGQQMEKGGVSNRRRESLGFGQSKQNTMETGKKTICYALFPGAVKTTLFSLP